MPAPAICHPEADWSCYGTADEIFAIDPELKEYAESLAWITFATLTGYRVGMCAIQLRPCSDGCNVGSYLSSSVLGVGEGWVGPMVGPFMPVLSGGRVFNITCGCGTDDCSCTTVAQVRLPAGAGRVESVYVDGAVLDPTKYRVDRGAFLVRTDGGAWPLCQDMSVAPESEGSFVVSYWPGAVPTTVDSRAVGVLAVEFLKSCQGDKNCRLPKTVTSVVRNGITYDLSNDLFASGRTGIREVDILIQYYNPNGLKRRPSIASPDRKRGRVTTSW